METKMHTCGEAMPRRSTVKDLIDESGEALSDAIFKLNRIQDFLFDSDERLEQVEPCDIKVNCLEAATGRNLNMAKRINYLIEVLAEGLGAQNL